MVHKIAFLLLLGSLSIAARADVFRWVDDDGKIHYGDTIPDRYKQKAKKLDSRDPEITEAQRLEAAARLAKEKARIDALEKSREARPNAVQTGSAPSPDVPPAAGTACEEQLKKYQDSLNCFSPYRNANGGLRPEAFQNCAEVKEPTGCSAPPASSDRNYIP